MEHAKSVFEFGKHRGRTFEDVEKHEKGYVTWCLAIDNPTGRMKDFCDYARSVSGGAPASSSQATPSPRGLFRDGVLQPGGRQSLATPAPSAPSAYNSTPSPVPQIQHFTDTLSLELRKDGFLIATEAFLPHVMWATINSWNGDLQPNKRSWLFRIERYNEILRMLQTNDKFSCPVIPIPDWVRRLATTAFQEDTEPDWVDDDTGLLPFQREGVKLALQRNGRILIGDEMGLGKTVQALCIMKNYPESWPVLVVCPSSLRFVWKTAALDWIDNFLPVQLIDSGKDVCDPTAKLVIISYNLLAKSDKFVRRADGRPYDMIIADESQYIKEGKAQRTKAVLQAAKSASRVVLLSGTPALNRACELYTQMAALYPKILPSNTAFCDRYANKEKIRLGHRVVEKWVGAKRKEELNLVLSSAFMVRRLKKDVLTQLPPKRRQKINLDPRSLDKKKIAEIQEVLSRDKDDKVADDNPNDIPISLIFQLTAQAKLDAVVEYVDVLLELDVKFLLFAHHYVMLDALEESIQKKTKGNYIRIDGKTSQALRPGLVSKFQDDEAVRVALLSITACGQGLTLTAASTVVFAELYWVPGQMLQAEDRVHRIGQNCGVNVQYIAAPSTLDDLMYASLNKKSRDTTGILDGCERSMEASDKSTQQGTRIAERDTAPRQAPANEEMEVRDLIDDVRKLVNAKKQEQAAKKRAAGDDGNMVAKKGRPRKSVALVAETGVGESSSSAMPKTRKSVAQPSSEPRAKSRKSVGMETPGKPAANSRKSAAKATPSRPSESAELASSDFLMDLVQDVESNCDMSRWAATPAPAVQNIPDDTPEPPTKSTGQTEKVMLLE